MPTQIKPEQLDVLFNFETDGTFSAQTASYETLVLNNNDIPNKKYVDDSITTSSTQFVLKSGDTMTGVLTLNADPSLPLEAATKQYVDNKSVNFLEFIYTATAGQTTFTGPDDSASILTYTPGTIVVYINGIRQVPSEFVATDGTSVILSIPAVLGDIINIVSAATSSTQFVLKSGDTMTGTLVLNADPSLPLEASTKQYVDNTVSSNGNVIINGNMDIWQRGISFVSIPDDTYSVDRWVNGIVGGMVVDINRSIDTPDVSSLYSTFINVTTANGVLAAIDNSGITQRIEGNNYRRLVNKNATLSFSVKSNKTGTYCIAFRNDGLDRSYVVEYTINAINTWERKVITVPLTETLGTWNYDTGIGLRVTWSLTSGTSFQTTPNAWQVGDFNGTSNQVNFGDTIGNEFRLTKVQFETGDLETDFEYKSQANILNECQRYFEKSFDLNAFPSTLTFNNAGVSHVFTTPSGGVSFSISYKAKKRTSASIIIYSYLTGTAGRIVNSTDGDVIQAAFSGASEYSFTTAGVIASAGNNYLTFTADAEL